MAASVTVVVPARNEVESIEHSIGLLLEQEYAGKISIVLVDYNSSDGTAALAAIAAHGVAQWPGATVWLMAATFLPTLQRYRRFPPWATVLPAISLF